MEDLLKKFIYTGVGLLSLTTKRFKEIVDELVSDSKISSEEGKRIVDDFVSKTSTQRKEFEEEIKIVAAKFGADYGSTTQSDIDKLKERVSKLEQELHATKGSAGANNSDEAHESVVEKVKNNERASLGHDVLTPDKKMEAERERLNQQQSNRPAAQRVEEDAQKANLGQPPLTPDKKMEQDRKQSSKNID